MGLLSLYKQALKMQLKEHMEYRLNFIIGTIAMILATAVSVLYIWAIFDNIPSLNGWSFEQVLFLIGTSTIAYSLADIFLSGLDSWNIEPAVRNGEIDRALLRPIGTIPYFILDFCLNITEIGELATGLVITYFASSMLGIEWTLFSLLLYIIFLISASLIVFSFNVIISSLSFFIVKTQSISDLFWNFTKLTLYPLDIFNPTTRFIMTFIFPLGFVSYYPSQPFVGNGLWVSAAYLTPVIAIIMVGISYGVWKYCIKHYTSTGS